MKNTFYHHQEEARGNSAFLMFVLSIAICVTTLLTGLMVTFSIFVPLYCLFIHAFPRPETQLTIHLHPDRYHPVQLYLVEHLPWLGDFPFELFAFFYLVITVAVGLAIIIVTRNKMRRLREAGGVGVAHSLAGVNVSAEGYRRDDRTQRAVNVVNEIAIASRVGPPQVYLLPDEPGINAFAVGLTSRDMVVGLTHGCIANLNREQMQAVVAHEFAHISNGDTKINVLLVGYLHGLMAVIICAQSLIDQGMKHMVRSISHGGQGFFGMFCLISGTLLWPVGLIGLCFSMMVKAAYSRQREFLADASAVEYTRNPVGLVGAMKRILGNENGSRIQSARCLALSHVFFGKSCTGIAGFLDSHPRLEKRIRRVDPTWDGEVEYEEEHQISNFDGVFSGTMSLHQQARPTNCGRIVATPETELADVAIHDSVVMGVKEHAASVRSLLPPGLWELTQDLPTAEAMIFALFAVGTRPARRDVDDDDGELEVLGNACATSQQVAKALRPHVEVHGLPERLMLFDAAVNQIRKHGQQSDLTAFCKKAEALLGDPDDDDLFRWAWRKTIQQVIEREQESSRVKPEFRDVSEALKECTVVLSALAYANDGTTMENYSLLRAGNVLGHDLHLLPKDCCDLPMIEFAVQRLRLLAPKARQRVVLAGSASIVTDGEMNDEEALLMRGICSGLGYPPATLLPGQPVSAT